MTMKIGWGRGGNKEGIWKRHKAQGIRHKGRRQKIEVRRQNAGANGRSPIFKRETKMEKFLKDV